MPVTGGMVRRPARTGFAQSAFDLDRLIARTKCGGSARRLCPARRRACTSADSRPGNKDVGWSDAHGSQSAGSRGLPAGSDAALDLSHKLFVGEGGDLSRLNGRAELDVHHGGPRQRPPTRPRLEGAVQSNGHQGHAGPLGQRAKPGLQRHHLAGRCPGSFRENENHLLPTQTAERFFEACNPDPFAIYGDCAEPSDQPAERCPAEQALPGEVVEWAVARQAHQNRIEVTLMIAQQQRAAAGWQAAAASTANAQQHDGRQPARAAQRVVNEHAKHATEG